MKTQNVAYKERKKGSVYHLFWGYIFSTIKQAARKNSEKLLHSKTTKNGLFFSFLSALLSVLQTKHSSGHGQQHPFNLMGNFALFILHLCE
jgi:hypothetical protein